MTLEYIYKAMMVVGPVLIVLPIMILIARRIGIVLSIPFFNEKKRKDLKSRVYLLIRKVPFSGQYFKNVKKRLYFSHYMDIASLERKTIDVVFISSIWAIVVFILLLIPFKNPILSIIVAVAVFRLRIEKKIGDDYELLGDLTEGIKDLNHNYIAENKAMEKAFEETIKVAPRRIALHFQRILEIIKKPSKEADREVKRYYEECQNKYLRLIAGYSLLTSEYGDIETNEGSLFQKNMFYIIREIQNEYRQRKNLKNKTFGESFFIIAPIIALPLLKKYMIMVVEQFNIPIKGLSEFYNGSLGYIDMLTCVTISGVCFLIYTELMKSNEVKRIKLSQQAWEEKFIRIKPIGYLVKKLTPEKRSKKHQRIKNLMIKSGKLEKLEWFYFRKLILFITSFVLILSIVQGSKILNKYQVLQDLDYGLSNKYIYQNMIRVQRNLSRQEKENLIEEDKELINILNHNKDKLPEKNLREYIIEILEARNLKVPVSVEMTAERILMKYRVLSNTNTFYTILEVLFIVLLSLLIYNFPNIKMSLSAKINRETVMYDETMGFYTIAILLMHHKSATTEMVIQWLAWFADIFYKPLYEIKNRFADKDRGGVKALRELKEEVDYKPFKRLLDSLIIAEDRLPLYQAFTGIEQDQRFNERTREDNSELLISIKSGIITRLGWISLGATSFLYFVIPIVWSIFSMLMDTYGAIQPYW
ncbi:hypothetical protein [Sporosalibacterium faouarense]|uniref:hypothetical protein n=1 Tax=Sporosalibacterium faouarense TaxID=516123 RepID=UPI00192ADD35|nr:hypothetical protein [Sporosalibacterium faouarense]